MNRLLVRTWFVPMVSTALRARISRTVIRVRSIYSFPAVTRRWGRLRSHFPMVLVPPLGHRHGSERLRPYTSGRRVTGGKTACSGNGSSICNAYPAAVGRQSDRPKQAQRSDATLRLASSTKALADSF
ncbi:hypothetical protein BD413DRAFT_562932 [Trametes elegans]|nr:hypothetical protein BD413DRAFT_562932 [Trametes elegans]